MTKILISIIGPTAIGKTALSIKLAHFFNTEIISADSRQFFKEMTIGTAAPTKAELQAVTHHFIHHKSINDTYNVGAFEKESIKTIETLFKKHNTIIMVGGSGLYVDAIINGLDTFPEIDKSIREKLNLDLKTKGLKYLQDELKKHDKIAFETIAIDNPHRVIRALEICKGSGKAYSSFLNKEKRKRSFKTISIGLTAPREVIYSRINNRVDMMMQNGLLNEVENLLPYKKLNALNTVGYKELFNYFEGKWELDFAISEIKKNSRRFAKRQITWFKKNKDIFWFDYLTDIETIVNTISKELKNS